MWNFLKKSWNLAKYNFNAVTHLASTSGFGALLGIGSAVLFKAGIPAYLYTARLFTSNLPLGIIFFIANGTAIMLGVKALKASNINLRQNPWLATLFGLPVLTSLVTYPLTGTFLGSLFLNAAVGAITLPCAYLYFCELGTNKDRSAEDRQAIRESLVRILKGDTQVVHDLVFSLNGIVAGSEEEDQNESLQLTIQEQQESTTVNTAQPPLLSQLPFIGHYFSIDPKIQRRLEPVGNLAKEYNVGGHNLRHPKKKD